MSDQKRKLEAIFHAARELSDPDQREIYVRDACQGDPALRAKVEGLLRASAEAESVFGASNTAPAAPTTIRLDSPIEETTGTLVGRYKLLQKVGEGGMGVVYMAEQTEPVTRKVALKIIKLGMDTKQVVARFEAERQALAMMDHPNIAKVFDAGATDSGRPYFVMELVRGVPITEYCDKNKLSTQERLALFIPVCQAIQHAHQKGVIHRDIKPANVMVTLDDGAPHPMVIDFGIAKATNQKLTEKTLFTNYAQMIGTPAYMSPEQAEMSKLDVDTRTDVYSLGVLLYELLTGTTPFPSKELLSLGYGEMQKVIAEREPPKPSTRLSTMRDEERTVVAKNRNIEASALGKVFQGDLDWIVMKALEKDRTHRYETVNGLVADVKRHLNNEPVSAAAPTFGYQFHKFVRRNRKHARVAATVAVSLLVATTIAAVQAVRATRAKQLAEAAGRAELAQRILAQEKQKDAEAAEAAESRQRIRAEGLLDSMQLQRAGELLDQEQTLSGAGYLIKMLRANPSNEVAAARLASLMMQPFGQLSCPPVRHDEHVFSAQFSPDGLKVVTGSWEKTARVWDARTGQSLIEPLRHDSAVTSAQFSPDGRWVVTASFDRTARVWDAITGRPVTEPLQHEGGIYSAQFSPDGLRVVTASDDRTARVWDARTGQPVTEPLRHEGEVNSATFSPDGLRVVTTSQDRTARVWDASTGQPVTDPLRHDGDVRSAQFSPDSLRVVTASDDRTARVWDARTGQPVTEPLRHRNRVHSARFSPDGFRVVTASQDYTARVWDARTGLPLTESLRHDGTVGTAQFSPDGLRVVTASADNTARVWDARTGEAVVEPLLHDSRVNSAQFSPDGLRVVTVSGGNTVRLWDVHPSQLPTETLRHKDKVYFAQFSPDGLQVITASGDVAWEDISVRLWDVRTAQPITEPLRLVGGIQDAQFGPISGIQSGQFGPDGPRVITTGGRQFAARVWDVRTAQPVTEPMPHENYVRSPQFSPDGLRVVTSSADKTARVWDARTGKPVTEPLRHEDTVHSARFSPDGLRVVTASEDKTARVWDARTGEPVTEPLRHEREVFSAQFSPDGLRVVTASWDKTARVWDARTGEPLTEPLRHEGAVNSAQFSPDGQRILTGGHDDTLRVWDARTGELVTELRRQGSWVGSAQFSPDGLRVVTGGGDNRARVWDVRTGQPVTGPLRHEGGGGSAQFSPDGSRVLILSEDTAQFWAVVPRATPVPDWFLDWAEIRLNRRFSDGKAAGPVELSDRLRLQQAVAARTDTNYYTRLAQWAQADPIIRTISPLATLTVQEYVQQQIAENSLDSLYEALRLNPANSLAWARLSQLEWQQITTQASERLVQAEFSARQALRLDSANGEAWSVLGAMQLQSGQVPEASESVQQALRFGPDHWRAWELKGDLLARQQRPAEALEAYRRGADALVGAGLSGVQARAELLERSLQMVAALRTSSGENSSGREALLDQARELARAGRTLSVLDLGEALEIWQRLAGALWASNDTARAELLLNGFLGGLERVVAASPEDTDRASQLALVQLWMGQTNHYVAESRKLLDRALATTSGLVIPTLDHAAKTILVQTQPDSETRRKAAEVGREALNRATKYHWPLEHYRTTTALASLREGRPEEAETLLNVVLDQPVVAPAGKVLALACRAVARARLNQKAEALADLEAVKRMLPPFGPRPTPSAVLLRADSIAAALLFEEANALLTASLEATRP